MQKETQHSAKHAKENERDDIPNGIVNFQHCLCWFLPHIISVFQTSRLGNSQVPADFPGEKFVDFGVPRHGGTAVGRGIAPPGMVAAFADENATLRVQMPD